MFDYLLNMDYMTVKTVACALLVLVASVGAIILNIRINNRL